MLTAVDRPYGHGSGTQPRTVNGERRLSGGADGRRWWGWAGLRRRAMPGPRAAGDAHQGTDVVLRYGRAVGAGGALVVARLATCSAAAERLVPDLCIESVASGCFVPIGVPPHP